MRPQKRTLQRSLDEYPLVVERQGVTKLVELDRWYRDELPDRVRSRQAPHITLEELVQVTMWKMARGVWRAPNLALVRSNPPHTVKETSTAALGKIPHATAPISEFAELRGVGPATASAVAAAVAPEIYPFFDELVAAQIPGLGKVAWTLGYYKRYAEALREWAQELGGSWTPAALERALWAYVGGKAGARSPEA